MNSQLFNTNLIFKVWKSAFNIKILYSVYSNGKLVQELGTYEQKFDYVWQYKNFECKTITIDY